MRHLKQNLLIALGGGLGSCARYLFGLFFGSFMYGGYFWINVIGCFLTGCVMEAMRRSESSHRQWFTLFMVTGFCGGFTTFSSVCIEQIVDFQDYQNGYRLFYLVMNNFFFCFLAVALGCGLVYLMTVLRNKIKGAAA